jgi:5-methylcytosine-specific restriction endonuclease McrA
LKDKVRSEIGDLTLVSFPDPKKRRLGVLRDDATLPEVEWPEAKLEIGPALKVEVPKINVTPLGVPYFMSQVKVFLRNPRVVELAKLRANGLCERCGCKAPFLTTAGQPYLEVHHVVPLAKNGPDTLENVSALCPNCHREAHFGANSLT